MSKQNHIGLVRIIFACVMLASLLSGFAMADVIWEPNNDFYAEHSNECEYVNRNFYSNGENGYMEIFTEPGGSSLGFAENGKIFHVQFSYKLGDEIWGVVEYTENNGRLEPRGANDFETGWIKLSDTVLKYDYQSFDEDHSSEYKPYDGDYSELEGIQNIVMWTFPNSGETTGTLDKSDENLNIQSVYTDIDGVKWGFVSYYYAMKNFWICLSNPADTALPAKDVPVPEFYTPAPDSEPQPTGNNMATVIIICVAAVVLSTAILFSVFNRKKHNKADKKQVL